MIIPERFFLRHQILKILCERFTETEKFSDLDFDISFFNVTTQTISEKLNLSVQRIHELSSKMVKEEEVEFDTYKNEEVMRAKHNGIVAVIDRKYLLGGRDFIIDSFLKYLAIISGIILLIISVLTFILNIIETRENRNDIKNIEKKIQQMELKKN
jgi:hypothetical protein